MGPRLEEDGVRPALVEGRGRGCALSLSKGLNVPGSVLFSLIFLRKLLVIEHSFEYNGRM
jgi:hypothetical protein